MNPNTDTAKTQKVAPIYLLRDGELLLDAPIGKVWRCLIDYPSWQNYSIVQHVSGTPGEEGEVVLLKKEEGAIPTTPYYARTIKLDPGRRVVWKTFRENSGNFGIVDFRVIEDVQDKTRFYYSTVYEHSVPYETESELDATRKQQYDNLDAVTALIFAKLKKLVEERGRNA